MSEIRLPINAIKVSFLCEECNRGEYVVINFMGVYREGIQYPHACTNCHHEMSFPKIYPHYEYE